MRGSLTITFSELFKDTLDTHGTVWAWNHYVVKGGMKEWEYKFWLAGWMSTGPLSLVS